MLIFMKAALVPQIQAMIIMLSKAAVRWEVKEGVKQMREKAKLEEEEDGLAKDSSPIPIRFGTLLRGDLSGLFGLFPSLPHSFSGITPLAFSGTPVFDVGCSAAPGEVLIG